MLKNAKYYPVTFPIQFPNASLSVSLTRTYSNVDGTNSDSLAVDSMGPANMNVTNAGRETYVYYIVVGY